MGIFDRFPHSSTHEMNLDFMLGRAQEINTALQQVTEALPEVQTGLAAISEKTEIATEAAEEAEQNAEAAQTHAGTAMTWRSEAMHYANQAQASAAQAQQIATTLGDIETAQEVCTDAQAAAETASTNAAGSARAAHTDAVNAGNANTQAGTYAANAASSANAANSSATNANNAKADALRYATAADGFRATAETASSNAQSAATNAQTSATNAATSATNAATAATQVLGVKEEIEDLIESLPADFTDVVTQVNTNTGNIASLSDEIDSIGSDVTDLKSALNEYRTGSQKFQSYYKHTLALIVGYYNNRGVLVEAESGWRTTEKLSTTVIPSLSINPSHCQIWKDGSYIGQYNYADFESLPAFDTIVFTWNKNNVPASGIVLTPIGETYIAMASLEDEVSGIDGSVVEMGGQITANKQEFDDFVNRAFEKQDVTPDNLLNFSAITPNTYITESGVTGSNSVYMTSDYIPVTPGSVYSLQYGAQTAYVGRKKATINFLCAFDSSKNVMQSSGGRSYTDWTCPENVAYIRISFQNMTNSQYPAFVKSSTVVDWSEYFEPYISVTLKDAANSQQTRQNTQDIADLQEQIGTDSSAKCIFSAKAATLAANQNLICCNSCDNKKNEYIELTAKFSTFGELTIAHGKGSYMGGYITITESKIQIYTYNGTLIEEYDHGLTIEDFINVIIYTKNDASCRSKITIMSSGGDYTASTTKYYSCRAAVLCNATFAMTDVQMKYTVNDAKEDVWVFGDSYISMGDPNRWATQAVQDGHIKMMIHGFGGATSMNEIVPFRALLDVARPKIIVWALGMNDGDTSSAVNTNWKTCVDEVIATCEAKGITLILATIPNVPNVINTFKNAYVKSTGLRYVDFAKAVNAESAGATWYEGMLSSDNTHPNALGAKALMRQFLQDVPEVLYAED